MDYPDEWLAMREWLRGFRRYLRTSPDMIMRGHGLVLSGDPGVGKSMLAASFLNYLQAKGFSTAFVRDFDLVRLMNERYPSEDDVDLFSYLQRSACLVLDDLGRTAGAVEAVEPFLRYRLDEAKPTIVTMNRTVALTATLESFLHEYTFVTLTGVDRRKSPLERDHARW